MTVSAAPRRQWRSGLLGAFAFAGVQNPLLLATPPVPGMTAPGWFLNSGRNILLIAAVLAAGAAVLTARKAASDGDAVLYGLGAIVAMIATLFAIGPGTIFPIVITFGCGLVVFAVGVGGTCGAGLRARRMAAVTSQS